MNKIFNHVSIFGREKFYYIYVSHDGSKEKYTFLLPIIYRNGRSMIVYKSYNNTYIKFYIYKGNMNYSVCKEDWDLYINNLSDKEKEIANGFVCNFRSLIMSISMYEDTKDIALLRKFASNYWRLR